MMRNALFILLSLLAAVPPVLAAQPVFHCSSTGVEGFVMECCLGETGCCGTVEETVAVVEAPRSCCSGGDVEEPTSDVSLSAAENAAACGCCSVSFIRLIAVESRASSFEWLFAFTAALVATDATPVTTIDSAPATNAPLDRGPPERPGAVSLPILYASLLV